MVNFADADRRAPAHTTPTAVKDRTTLRPLLDLVGSERSTIPLVFEARVERTPDAPFVLWNGSASSYGDTWHQVMQFAAYATERGFGGAGQRIASFLSNCPAVFWTWFGTQMTGATYVSLNRAHRGVVLQDMISRSGARLLVTESTALPLLAEIAPAGLPTVLVVDGIDDDLDVPFDFRTYGEVEDTAPGTPVRSDPSAIATVMFTSGTSGRSKAVPLSHNQFCRGAAYMADAIDLSPRDVFHAWLPLFHIGGQLHVTVASVIAGAALALFPTFSRSKFLDQVRDTGATAMMGFANVAEWLLAEPMGEDDAANPLRIAVIANMPAAIHRLFEARFGLRVVDTYGMTEAEMLTASRLDGATPIGSCGPSGPDFDLAILDDDDFPLPVGRTGQIAVRPRVPDVITAGYENDAAATVAAWRNLWFHTGDLGYVDQQGYVFFVGRAVHRIRRGGENVSAEEVWRIIAEHLAIDECVVVGVPSSPGEDEVKAIVVLKPNQTLEPSVLHAYCVDRMAKFMVPRYIEVSDHIPRSDVGKPRYDLIKTNSEETWDAQRDPH